MLAVGVDAKLRTLSVEKTKLKWPNQHCTGKIKTVCECGSARKVSGM